MEQWGHPLTDIAFYIICCCVEDDGDNIHDDEIELERKNYI